MSNRPRVLVINDDDLQRERIVKIIAGICDVVAPRNHPDLVACLAEGGQAYSLVILDYVFELWNPPGPPRNGADVLAALRPKDASRPQVIMLTNFDDEKTVRRTVREYHVPMAKASNVTPAELYAAVVTLLTRDGWPVE